MPRIKVTYRCKWNSREKTVVINADYTSDNRVLALTANKLGVSESEIVIVGWKAV